MSVELLINVMLLELWVVLIENGILQEVYVECYIKCGLVGNIYCGKVSWVLFGMQVVFVDIGLEKVVFLYVLDIVIYNEVVGEVFISYIEKYDICDLVCDGQDIVV